jgi:hypothetical protein
MLRVISGTVAGDVAAELAKFQRFQAFGRKK